MPVAVIPLTDTQRSQTDQDRERLREGLAGSGGVDAASVERLLEATRKRVFLFRMTASADIAGRAYTNAVSTRLALKGAWPELLCPPPGLDGVLTIGVKAK